MSAGNGHLIASLCYEYIEGGQKRYKSFGSLWYYRNHSGGTPSAQIRLDLIPSKAWSNNPDTWFIGNFKESEEIKDPPYVEGQIFVPSDVRGDRLEIGHIGTRETADGESTQYYLQFFGVPLRAITLAIKASLRKAMDKAFDECEGDLVSRLEFYEKFDQLISKKKHSIYLPVDLDG